MADLAARARRLSVPIEAVELCAGLVDLHVIPELGRRWLGLNPAQDRGDSRWPRPFFGHVDWPRLRAAGVGAVGYDWTPSPFGQGERRWSALEAAFRFARAQVDATDGVRWASVESALSDDASLALMPTVQGGHAFEAGLGALDGPIGRWLTRVTLVHLTRGPIGASSAPGGGSGGLTEMGCRLVDALVRNQIAVDLAHASPRTFDDALREVPLHLPVVVTHTGASDVRPHWRNVTRAQVRAIADRGGVVGVMLHGPFLARWPCPGPEVVADHVEALRQAGGAQVVALGSDFDGFILPVHGLHGADHWPRLTAALLRRGWSADEVRGLVCDNWRRTWRRIRPPATYVAA